MRISNNIGIRVHDVNEHTFKHLFAVTHNYGLNLGYKSLFSEIMLV